MTKRFTYKKSKHKKSVAFSSESLDAASARRFFSEFANLVRSDLDFTEFHRNYYRLLDAFAKGKVRRLIVTVPPQHGKSLGASCLLPAYLLGLNPDLRIAIGSYSASLARKFGQGIQRVIDNEVYQQLFPATYLKGMKTPVLPANPRVSDSSVGAVSNVLDSQTKAVRSTLATRTVDEFDCVGRSGGVMLVGRECSLTGNRVDVMILDDLYKDALESNSPVVRENTWDWYTSVVRTRMHNASGELIVFTRWHEDDLIGRLERSEQVVDVTDFDRLDTIPERAWVRVNFEAIKTSPIPKYTSSCTLAPASKTGATTNTPTPSHAKTGATTNTPTPSVGTPPINTSEDSATDCAPIDNRQPGEALWPARHSLELLRERQALDSTVFESLYQGHPSAAEGLLYGPFETYATLPEGRAAVRRGNYTDTADTGDDNLCSICYVVGADGLIYLTDVVYTDRPMESTERRVAEMLSSSGATYAYIESNNGGRGFARAVKRLLPMRSVELRTFHQRNSKEARILSNASEVMRLIRMPTDWILRWETFSSDLGGFRSLFRANRHDDAPDALTGVVETESTVAKRITGFTFTIV